MTSASEPGEADLEAAVAGGAVAPGAPRSGDGAAPSAPRGEEAWSPPRLPAGSGPGSGAAAEGDIPPTLPSPSPGGGSGGGAAPQIAERERRRAAKARRRGLLLVFTGEGKGKSTAAFGLALRAAGNRLPVKVVQFIKGSWKTGEREAIRQHLPGIEVEVGGRGFTIERLRDPKIALSEHELAARAAFRLAQAAVASGRYRMVVLDEILGSISAGLVSESQVLELARSRPADLHLVLTGRGASPAIIDAADLVTEMKEVKHHYRAGIPAQRGIEF